MAGIGFRLRDSHRLFHARRFCCVALVKGTTTACSTNLTVRKCAAANWVTPLNLSSNLAASTFLISPCTAAATLVDPADLPLAAVTFRTHTSLPFNCIPFSRRVALRLSPSSCLSSDNPHSLLTSSISPLSAVNDATPVIKAQHQWIHEKPQQQIRPREQQVESRELYVRGRNLHNYTRRRYECQQGRNQQREQGQHHQSGASGRALAMLAVSPLLFTEWDKTLDPKNELLFLAGNALGYCTEKFFENEYGQSIFACILGLVYLALLGYEGKVYGAVWRMKHLFGTNMKIVGHPRYAHALPKNPLLCGYQKCPSK